MKHVSRVVWRSCLEPAVVGSTPETTGNRGCAVSARASEYPAAGARGSKWALIHPTNMEIYSFPASLNLSSRKRILVDVTHRPHGDPPREVGEAVAGITVASDGENSLPARVVEAEASVLVAAEGGKAIKTWMSHGCRQSRRLCSRSVLRMRRLVRKFRFTPSHSRQDRMRNGGHNTRQD